MVDSISAVQTSRQAVQLTSILRARFTNSPVSLPLAAEGVYARFKHVQGVPTGTSSEGYSLTKLQMLDALIERLTGVRASERAPSIVSQAASTAEAPGLVEELDFEPLVSEVARRITEPGAGLLFDYVA